MQVNYEPSLFANEPFSKLLHPVAMVTLCDSAIIKGDTIRLYSYRMPGGGVCLCASCVCLYMCVCVCVRVYLFVFSGGVFNVLNVYMSHVRKHLPVCIHNTS